MDTRRFVAEKMNKVAPSETLAITAKAKAMRQEGIDVANFAAGEPDFDTPAFIKEAAKKAIDDGFTKYTPSSGTPELREAVCRKFKRDNGLEYKPSHVVIGCGAKHALYNIFQAICDAGDEVIIPSPYWLSYPEMVTLAGGKPVFAECERGEFKLTAKMLENLITHRTKAVIINSPSNPVGTVYTREELDGIAEVAADAGILVVSDEIYEKLVYGGLRHISIASLNSDIFELVLVVNGVSKSYSMTGWRIGYVAGANGDVISAIAKVQSHATSNPTSIAQKAALAAIEQGEESARRMCAVFEKRRDMMVEHLNRIKPLKPFKPDGAFYVFVDISASGMDSGAFAQCALEEAHIAMIPGKPFGWDDHVRLSFAASEDEIGKGLERLGKWVRQLRKK